MNGGISAALIVDAVNVWSQIANAWSTGAASYGRGDTQGKLKL